MPQGDKSKYTDKQKRQAQHIEESYEEHGASKKDAESHAWATVNATDGGGKKSGSGRAKSGSARKTTAGKKPAAKTAARKAPARKTAAKKRATKAPAATSPARRRPAAKKATAATEEDGGTRSEATPASAAPEPGERVIHEVSPPAHTGATRAVLGPVRPEPRASWLRKGLRVMLGRGTLLNKLRELF